MGKGKKVRAAVISVKADCATGTVTLVMNRDLVQDLGCALTGISNADNRAIAPLRLSPEEFGAISLIANTIGDCACPDCFAGIGEEW
jgi:hypothetical protein